MTGESFDKIANIPEIHIDSPENVLEQELKNTRAILEAVLKSVSNTFPNTTSKTRADHYIKRRALESLFKDDQDRTKENFINNINEVLQYAGLKPITKD